MFVETKISAKEAEDIVTGITIVQNAEVDILNEDGSIAEVIALPPSTAKALIQQKLKLKSTVEGYREVKKTLSEKAAKSAEVKEANFEEIGEQYNAAIKAASEELHSVEILFDKIKFEDFGKVGVKSVALELLENIIE